MNVDGVTIPAEPNSTFTGYPVWLVPTGMSDDVERSLALFVVASTVGAAVFASYTLWSRKIPYNRDYSLYHLITLYCWTTAASMTVSRYITGGTGKYFSPAGGFHNWGEFIILFTFLAEGEPKYDWYVWWFSTFLYVGLVFLVHWLPWPYDALFFKFQGLVGDACLPIVFTQLWIAQWNDKKVPNFNYAASVVAALMHFAGNIVISVWGGRAAVFYTFTMSYALAYPLYSYFVRVITAPKGSNFDLPNDDPEHAGSLRLPVDSEIETLMDVVKPPKPGAVIYPHPSRATKTATFLGGVVLAALTIIAGL